MNGDKIKLVLIAVFVVILINFGILTYFYLAPEPESSPIPVMLEFCHADNKELLRKNLNNQLFFACAIVQDEQVIFEEAIDCSRDGEDWTCKYV